MIRRRCASRCTEPDPRDGLGLVVVDALSVAVMLAILLYHLL